VDRVLVTGGFGFIGHHLLKKLSQSGCKITVVDNLTSGNKSFQNNKVLTDNISFYEEDIRHTDVISDISHHERIDTCIHLAAKVSIADSVSNPFVTLDVNVNGTLSLLQACSNNQVKNFVFASSSSVYGNPKKFPIPEDQVLDPLSPYAASKAAAEMFVSCYRNMGKIRNAVCLRFSNVYGEGHSLGSPDVITKFAERLSKGLPPVIYGDGQQIRDFVSVNDVTRAILLAANPHIKTPASFDVFNIASGKCISISDLAIKMIKISGLELKPIYAHKRHGDIKYSNVDTAKANRILGFTASEKLESGLTQILKSPSL
jgi:UDP-glucose 4-epimerase